MSTFARFPEWLQQAIVARLGWSSLRPVQDQAGAEILAGKNAVVLAPTAGGKTEAAFFPILANLVERPTEAVAAIYVAPIKALLNNQEERLGTYTEMVGLRRFVWHGDTRTSAKRNFCESPAEILMTTPESLEVMLLSSKVPVGKLFRDLRYLVVDEIHALAGTDRGAHLMSVAERMARVTENDIQRIGLSATVGNPGEILAWLQGTSRRAAVVVDPPKEAQKRRIAVHFLPSITAIAAEAARQGEGHKSLLFCQSRALTESVAENMRRRGTDVYVHHSSVSLEERQEAEERFQRGTNVAIVSTSTLELGIDVGDLDLVFQADAASTVSSFLQRMGRTGRRAGQVANTTFLCEEPQTVLQAAALVELAREHWVESVPTQTRCWPVVVHQLLAMTMQFGGVSRERAWEQLSRVKDFSGIERAEFDRLIAFMLENEFLFEAGGLLSMGDRAEKVFGRRNFMEMYAVFSSPVLYTVVTQAGKPVGSLEQDFVDRLVEEMSSFLLGGRGWTVETIDHRERVVRVRNAPGGQKPSWGGFVPQLLGFEICQKVRAILMSDDEYKYLVGDAAKVMDDARVDLGPLLRGNRYAVRMDGGAAQWWTFAGGRINHTLRYAIQYATGWKVVPDNLSLRIEGDGLGHETVRDTLQYISDETFWDTPAVGRAIVEALPDYRLSKFQLALPPPYARETVGRYLLDHAGARAFLTELARRPDVSSGLTRPPPVDPNRPPWGAKPAPPSVPAGEKPLDTFGDYQLLEKLSGGMSEAFRARHVPTGQPVFLKRVVTNDRWDASALERELQIYEQLQRSGSQAVLSIRDVLRRDGYVALVTDLADGGDLADHVEAQPGARLTPQDAKPIAIEVAQAIRDLHAQDIVHRDLKPSNVLRAAGHWKLTDFGIAKNLVRQDTRHTFREAGTPGYTAPEQFDGVAARPSADIYSLGKLLTFLLTGHTDPDHVPYPSWRRLIEPCVARDPDRRPPIDSVVADLGRIPT